MKQSHLSNVFVVKNSKLTSLTISCIAFRLKYLQGQEFITGLSSCKQLIKFFTIHESVNQIWGLHIYNHCVKCVQVRSFFWSVFFHIRTEYGKIQTRENSVFGHNSRSNYCYIIISTLVLTLVFGIHCFTSLIENLYI